MKNYRKINVIIILCLFLTSILCLAIGCKPQEQELVRSIGFTEKTITLDINQSKTLIPQLNNITGQITWVSSDTSVVSVTSDGVVKAEGIGSAEISASIGDITAKVNVIVTNNGKYPVLKIEQITGNKLEILSGQPFYLRPYILYDNQTYQGIYSYSVDGTGITVSPEGLVNAVSLETSYITVSSTWKSIPVSQTIEVIVKENCFINGDDELTLYTSDKFGGQKTAMLDLSVYENGVLVENPQFDYNYDTNLLFVDENTNIVSSLKNENSSSSIMVSYVTSLQNEITFTVRVNVIFPVQDRTEDIVLPEFDLQKEEEWLINSGDIFDDGALITRITDSVQPNINIYNQGALLLGEELCGERVWTVYNDAGYAYNVKALVVEVITTYTRFAEIFFGPKWAFAPTPGTGSGWGGYYVLGNNIEFPKMVSDGPFANDITGDVYANKHKAFNSDTPTDGEGFNGTFDGRGYTVSKFSIRGGSVDWETRASIFGTIGKKGVVKNVSFTNISAVNRIDGIIANQVFGTIDNVFIGVDLHWTYWGKDGIAWNYFGGICKVLTEGATISNCVVYVTSPRQRPADESSVINSKEMASFVRDYYGGTLINNYTITDIPQDWTASGGTRYSPAITYNHANADITEDQLKVFTSINFNNYPAGTFTGLSEDIWDLSEGKIPVMKSALTLSAHNISYTDGSTIRPGGEKVFSLPIRGFLDYFKFELDNSSKGTIASVDTSWLLSKLKLTAASGLTAGTTITVYMKYFDRIVDTLVYTVV
jgi:hypothetical protein